MQSRLSDPSYTDRLAHFLRSLGQTVLADGPSGFEWARRVRSSRSNCAWRVFYPDAEVQLGGTGDDEAPAA
jgi:hypothetical protein